MPYCTRESFKIGILIPLLTFHSIGMVHPDHAYERMIKMMASPPRRKDKNYWYMNNYDFLSSKVRYSLHGEAGKAVNMADHRYTF